MKVSFEEISGEKQCYTIKDSGWFPQHEAGYSLDAVVRLTVYKQDSRTVVVEGVLLGKRFTVCDRCGVPVEAPLQCEFKYMATTRQEIASDQPERECSDEDAMTMFLVEPVIDVDDILREQAFLAAPLRTLCDSECKGICAGCGVVLNNDTCHCSHDGSLSPFSVLRKLAGS